MGELVQLDKDTALVVFTGKDKLDPYIDQVRQEVNSFNHDLSTASGRKRTASLAAKVAKVKVRLDGLGKELVADWKKNAKVVDGARKKLREELDELKVIARKPLSDWEEEQERIEEEKKETLRLETLAKEKESEHEIAILFDEKFDRQLQEAKDLIAKQKADYEEGLKKQAVEDGRKALAEAESRAKQAVIDAERLAKEAAEREKLAIEQAKREREESAQREKVAAELAESNKLIAIERAKEEEQQRTIAEEKRKQDIIDARSKDNQLKAEVNNAILKVLVANGLSNDDGVKVITLIAKGQLPNTKITY